MYFPFDNRGKKITPVWSFWLHCDETRLHSSISLRFSTAEDVLFFLHSFRLLFSSTAFWRLSFWNHTQPGYRVIAQESSLRETASWKHGPRFSLGKMNSVRHPLLNYSAFRISFAPVSLQVQYNCSCLDSSLCRLHAQVGVPEYTENLKSRNYNVEWMTLEVNGSYLQINFSTFDLICPLCWVFQHLGCFYLAKWKFQ